MSGVLRKYDFCIWENKDADHLRGNRKTEQLIITVKANPTNFLEMSGNIHVLKVETSATMSLFTPS